MKLEQTLIIIKPDGVQRGYIGRIINRFEEKGLKMCAMKMIWLTKEKAAELYSIHKGKHFYNTLIKFITGGPVVLMVLEGSDAINVCRRLMGKTFGPEAEPGTIRGDFGISKSYNLIHGSDSPESAKHEISLFFTEDEIIKYDLLINPWLYDMDSE